MANSFTELIVWQKSHQLMLDIYKFTKLLPPEERYNRISQLQRSASSVPTNIAEGFGRYHYQENIQFCRQARGSLTETKNHIIAARDLGQAPVEHCNLLAQQCDEINKIINGYVKSIQRARSQLND